MKSNIMKKYIVIELREDRVRQVHDQTYEKLDDAVARAERLAELATDRLFAVANITLIFKGRVTVDVERVE